MNAYIAVLVHTLAGGVSLYLLFRQKMQKWGIDFLSAKWSIFGVKSKEETGDPFILRIASTLLQQFAIPFYQSSLFWCESSITASCSIRKFINSYCVARYYPLRLIGLTSRFSQASSVTTSCFFR
jgi:hypothetical protein